MKNILFYCLVFVSTSFQAALAQDDSSIDTYTTPTEVFIAKPTYPTQPLRNGEEGWVELNFMVDTEGNVFEPAVTNSYGNQHFSREAMEAVLKSKFEPAQFNGEPIIGSSAYRFSFNLSRPSSGASRPFVALYNDFNVVAESGTQEEVQEALDNLVKKGSKNHYENAFLNWANYRFALRFGNPLEQMHYLWAAIEKNAEAIKYLSDDFTEFGRREMLRLEMANNRMSEAIDTYELLEAVGDLEALELFKPAYEELLRLKSNDQSFSIKDQTDNNGSWFVGLFKQNFYIDNIVGKIDELKFRCDKKYAALVFDSSLDYSIPASWGKCDLQIIGDSSTTFEFFQY